MPSSLNALESDGTVPCRSAYETKLLVCGLARVFYGQPNSVYYTLDPPSVTALSEKNLSGTVDSRGQSQQDKSQMSERPPIVESNIGLPFHN